MVFRGPYSAWDRACHPIELFQKFLYSVLITPNTRLSHVYIVWFALGSSIQLSSRSSSCPVLGGHCSCHSADPGVLGRIAGLLIRTICSHLSFIYSNICQEHGNGRGSTMPISLPK